MFVHGITLNSCVKCGDTKPNLDSDDMVPCWSVECGNPECDQGIRPTSREALSAAMLWNKLNPVKNTPNESNKPLDC